MILAAANSIQYDRTCITSIPNAHFNLSIFQRLIRIIIHLSSELNRILRCVNLFG